MNSDNYVVIQGWMCNELELKGNDLLVFALIYGFSQDGESRFSGSRSYIANTFNISLPTVDKALKNLIAKGLIEQHKTEINGVVFNEYNSLQGVKKLYRGSKETLHNKTSNKQIDKENFNSKKQELKLQDFGNSKKLIPKQSMYTKCMNEICIRNYDTYIHNALIDYLKLRLEMKDKPLYANSWKGLLNKLDRDFTTNEEKLKVIRQSIERGYASFFPVNTYKQKNTQKDKAWNKNVKMDKITKEELEAEEKWREEMRKKGVQVDY